MLIMTHNEFIKFCKKKIKEDDKNFRLTLLKVEQYGAIWLCTANNTTYEILEKNE